MEEKLELYKLMIFFSCLFRKLTVISLDHMDVLTCLCNYQIPDGAIRKLLLTTPLPEPDSYRVDFRSVHVTYLNNLEEDDMYKRWRSNINEVTSAGYI